jgi:hypothetical protein
VLIIVSSYHQYKMSMEAKEDSKSDPLSGSIDPCRVPEFLNCLPHPMDDFSFSEWLGVSSKVQCDSCQFPLKEFVQYPITGRCGHTICGQCYRYCEEFCRNPLLPCPVRRCSDRHAFDKINHKKSFTVATAIATWEDIEESTGSRLRRANKEYHQIVIGLHSLWSREHQKLKDHVLEVQARTNHIEGLLGELYAVHLTMHNIVLSCEKCKEIRCKVHPDAEAAIKLATSSQGKTENLTEKKKEVELLQRDNLFLKKTVASLKETIKSLRIQVSMQCETESDEISSKSSQSSNRSCMMDGYDNPSYLPGWDQDPFRNFQPMYPRMQAERYTFVASPMYRNNKPITRGNRKRSKDNKSKPKHTKPEKNTHNTWRLFMDDINKREAKRNDKKEGQSKRKSRAKKTRKVSIEPSKTPSPVCKSTSEEEF